MTWVLVVDDHDDGREMLAFFFASHGFYVQAAASGERALALIRERGPPAIVITDVCMATMDGFEVAQRLRNEAPSLKIFAHTAMGSLHDPERLFDGVIRKPIDPHKILELVRRTLREEAGGPT